MEKVATFVRVSAHSNAENAARNQAKKLRDFCEANGYQVCDSATVIGDRNMASPMLMDLLKSAKDKGFTKIVMASTNRVVGTVEELEEIKKAFDESGLTIETLDGSFENGMNVKMLVGAFIAHADREMDDEDEEQVFGYDRTGNGLAVNESEAEVVKYIFARRLELATNPPAELIQEVIDEYMRFGEILTVEEAKARIPEHKITKLIEDEVAEKWPTEYKCMIEKQNHNRAIYCRKMVSDFDPSSVTESSCQPIVDREMWEKVQARLAEEQNGSGQVTEVMTLE